ncbi:MAG: sulfotransferase [Candidatus Electrothrix sp. AUS4]|nr:sulfotransferase [Candidatus Electrothrix sp. AUS4]
MSDNCPIFIVGSPRSGTTLLYHMLSSSGGFANYRAETHLFNLIAPYFGNLKNVNNKQKLLLFWTQSHFFQRSNLDPKKFIKDIDMNCLNYGDFLSLFMDSIAANQNVSRWAECTPTHLLYMNKIKKEIPNAKFIHIIRDGRDVALSLSKLQWGNSMPLLINNRLISCALSWRYLINKGKKNGKYLGNNYIEINFETLVTKPKQVLKKLSDYIEYDLDYSTIQAKSIGSVKAPNTSFTDKSKPINRWRTYLDQKDITNIEQVIGNELVSNGYQVSNQLTFNTQKILQRLTYDSFHSVKYQLKKMKFISKLGETPYDFDRKQ